MDVTKYKNALLTGSYNYLDDGQVYTTEDFVFLSTGRLLGGNLIIAEIKSPLDTGEVYTTKVSYECNHKFEPLEILIERSVGNKRSEENFKYNLEERDLSYTMIDDEGEKTTTEHHFSSRVFINSPAMSTSTLMTQRKRIDPLQRNIYHIVSSQNQWKFKSDLTESTLYILQQEINRVPITLADQNLKAVYCKIVPAQLEMPVDYHDFYLSKHFNLPYKATLSEKITIEIDHLQVFEDQLQKHLKDF